MPTEAQHRGWHTWLDRTSDELELLSVEGRRFVSAFRDELVSSFGEEGERAGQKVTIALRNAVSTVLAESGIEIDTHPASVQLVPGTTKTADLSFTVHSVQWVIEIKNGLEFNSFGAAVLEGLLFRLRTPEVRFVLFSLYSKMKARPARLFELLTELNVGHAFDHIAILSINGDAEEDWWSNAATQINAFFKTMPSPSAESVVPRLMPKR